MSVLNAVFLYFLLFAIIPIILFFLRRTQIEEIFFPTSRFIKDVMKKTKKKLDYKALFLMLLRILIICNVVFAAASLSLNTMSTVNSAKIIVIVDNSTSVLSSYKDKDYYVNEIERQLKTIKKQNKKNNIFYIFYKNGIPSVERNLSSMEIYKGIFDVEENLRFIYSESSLNGKIIVFSDNQEINFKNIRDNNNLKNINFVNIGKNWKSNIYVKNIILPSPAFSGQENLIGINFFNDSDYSIPFKSELYYNDVLIAEKSDIIEAQFEKKLFFNIKLENNSIHDFYVKISGDIIEWDNTYYFGLKSINNINILYSGEKLNYFLKNLFLSNSNYNPFNISSINNARVDESHILIINDTNNLENSISDIEEIIEKGKTILIFPQDNVNKFNLLNEKGILKAKIIEKTGGTRKIENKLGFENLSFFNIFFLKDFNEEEVIAYYNDRNPALIKYNIGKSTVYFFNRILSEESTDIVFSPYFVYEVLNIILEEKIGYYNVRQENIPFRCISSSNESVCFVKPGIYDFEGERIFLNIPIEESNKSVYTKDIFVYDDIEKSLKKIKIDKILLVLALILMLFEFYLCDKWRI
ncbi:MAG: BatA domain-containing protein [Candidatus Muirbacterium halophilum]|nr:BatA domain-containing protein [Candidatus Muirbacterium halophilum]MCK9475683.1 BatA domain-containing protein [Candidatus Muirbacterium halophilum]